VVLGGRADHRGTADVDLLDHLVLGRPAAAGRPLERVEVHADQVDELDAVPLGVEHVLRVVAQRQHAGVELGVQGLDAAAHDLGKAREVLDRPDGEPGVRQLASGAARGDQLHPERREPGGELDDAALVGDGQERPADADITRLRHPAAPYRCVTRTRRGCAGSRDTAPRAIWSTASQSISCSRGRSAVRTWAASVASGSAIARCAMTGPVSTPASTKCTVTPNTLTP
jgi:hypothetical protein